MQGRYDEALGVAEEVLQRTKSVDDSVFALLILICARNGRLDVCRRLLALLEKMSYPITSLVRSAMCNVLAQAGHLEEALHVTSGHVFAPNSGHLPSHTSMIIACRGQEQWALGLYLLEHLIASGETVDYQALSSALGTLHQTPEAFHLLAAQVYRTSSDLFPGPLFYKPNFLDLHAHTVPAAKAALLFALEESTKEGGSVRAGKDLYLIVGKGNRSSRNVSVMGSQLLKFAESELGLGPGVVPDWWNAGRIEIPMDAVAAWGKRHRAGVLETP